MIENKIGTKDWSMRINLSLVSICIVDSWLAFKQATGTSSTQAEFYINLAEQLIDNEDDNSRQEPRHSNSGEEPHRANLQDEINCLPRSGVSAHLVPTTQKRG